MNKWVPSSACTTGLQWAPNSPLFTTSSSTHNKVTTFFLWIVVGRFLFVPSSCARNAMSNVHVWDDVPKIFEEDWQWIVSLMIHPSWILKITCVSLRLSILTLLLLLLLLVSLCSNALFQCSQSIQLALLFSWKLRRFDWIIQWCKGKKCYGFDALFQKNTPVNLFLIQRQRW